MFDLTSSKLLILAVVALIVVGPKDFPLLLRTVGRYLGMIRRQANEFRAQFEDAMRESELADLKKEVEQLGKETTETLNDATRNVETHLGDVGRELDAAAAEVGKMPEASVIGQPGQTPAGLPHSPDDVTHVPPAEQGALADPGAIEPPPPAPILSERPMPPRESGTAELEPALGESGSNQTRSGA